MREDESVCERGTLLYYPHDVFLLMRTHFPDLKSVWGVSDDHSWIPNGEVLPWDAEKQPKPAFYAIADAFSGKSYTSS